MALKNEAAPKLPTGGAPLADVVGRLVSVALAHGASAEEIGRALEGAAARGKDPCPHCGAALRLEEGCAKCPCGYSRC